MDRFIRILMTIVIIMVIAGFAITWLVSKGFHVAIVSSLDYESSNKKAFTIQLQEENKFTLLYEGANHLIDGDCLEAAAKEKRKYSESGTSEQDFSFGWNGGLQFNIKVNSSQEEANKRMDNLVSSIIQNCSHSLESYLELEQNNKNETGLEELNRLL